MSRHYLVISDLHLADVEDHADGWKAYKGSRFLFDDELAALVEKIRAEHDGEVTLILNGDVFDFDLVTAVPDAPPWPVSRLERTRGLNPTAPKSVWKLERILAQHPRFVSLVADHLLAGHRVVYLLGNHDRELHFPEVRRALLAAVAERARQAGGELGSSHRGRCCGKTELPVDGIRFEPWFFYVPGEIYVEHGHQFDYYNSFKNQLEPTVESREGPTLALPMGNLSNRYLTTRMGFFNPLASDFVLNFLRYVHHWLKHYLFSRRGLVFPWLWGSLLVLAQLLRFKRVLGRARGPHGGQIGELAQRYGLPVPTVKQLNRLHSRPITNRVYRVVREFWLDRVLMAVIMTGGTIALALTPVPLWLKLMVPLSSFPLLYFIYEWLAQGETIFSVDKRVPEFAHAIAKLLAVRVVSFGHSHRPRLLALGRAATFVDTGAWAPVTRFGDMTRLEPGLRNYLVVSFASEPTVKLGSWMTLE
jgi:UDP-2,3-diacylglucosamine pyrophosphatase LpxH